MNEQTKGSDIASVSAVRMKLVSGGSETGNAARFQVTINTQQPMIVDGKPTNQLVFYVRGEWEMAEIMHAFKEFERIPS